MPDKPLFRAVYVEISYGALWPSPPINAHTQGILKVLMKRIITYIYILDFLKDLVSLSTIVQN